MRKPTLDEFIRTYDGYLGKNEYVRQVGFKSLYVRIGPRVLGEQWRLRVLDIANITASRPGSGTFSALVSKLRTEYSDLDLYVECVQNQRFWIKLRSMGFTYVDSTMSCYLLCSVS